MSTARLGFRAWRPEDLALAVSLWGDADVMALIDKRGGLTHDQVRERLELEMRHREEHGVQYWPFFVLDTDDFAGCAGLKVYPPEPGRFEMGFHLRRVFWGSGYATEAGKAVVRYAFEVLGLGSLLAGHNPANHASRKVLEKLGFTHLRDEYFEGTGMVHPLYELRRG
jgi:RimJ/RimL family protein N-acetyltransferase